MFELFEAQMNYSGKPVSYRKIHGYLRCITSTTECGEIIPSSQIMPKGYREYGEELDHLSIRIFPEQKKKHSKITEKNQ